MYAQTAYPVINLVETGRCIERQRRQAGLTVRELQTYFGFEYPQAIYKWQHGECLPTVDNLLALSRILRVPMEDLLVYEDQEVSCFLWKRGMVLRFAGQAAGGMKNCPAARKDWTREPSPGSMLGTDRGTVPWFIASASRATAFRLSTLAIA